MIPPHSHKAKIKRGIICMLTHLRQSSLYIPLKELNSSNYQQTTTLFTMDVHFLNHNYLILREMKIKIGNKMHILKILIKDNIPIWKKRQSNTIWKTLEPQTILSYSQGIYIGSNLGSKKILSCVGLRSPHMRLGILRTSIVLMEVPNL